MDLELMRGRVEALIKELKLLIDGKSLGEYELMVLKLKSMEQAEILLDIDNTLKAQEEYSKAFNKLASRGL